ncbi:MAG TPA: nuclear transport factor 2 family protein [Fimbriimonas sp.]|nr:nuclear transport factor 2 family protein [Fimbriimonas sp.]
MESKKDTILNLEKGFWEHGNDADFFKENFDDDGLNVIEPMGFIDKAGAVKMSSQAKPWKNVKMQDVHVQELTPDCVSLAYHGEGSQDGMDEPYRATISSVYVRRDGKWRLALTSHQPWKAQK